MESCGSFRSSYLRPEHRDESRAPGAERIAQATRRCAKHLLLPLLLLTCPALWGAITIDVNVSRDATAAATTIATLPFSTTSGNELLLAFIAADNVSGSNTTVTNVAGGEPGRWLGGPTYKKVQRRSGAALPAARLPTSA